MKRRSWSLARDIAPREAGENACFGWLGTTRGGNQPGPFVCHFLFGDVNTVPAIVLGAIKSGIRLGDQGIDRGHRVVRNSGADAHSRTDEVLADGSSSSLKAGTNTFGDFTGAFQTARDYRYELLAAEPANDVVGACTHPHNLAKKTQHIIADRMAEPIVD